MRPPNDMRNSGLHHCATLGLCLALFACSDDSSALPPDLNCTKTSECADGETCAIRLSEAGAYFDTTAEGLTGEQRCNLVLAGRCEEGRFLVGCWCYFGPHFLEVPEDQRGHLVCGDPIFDAGIID